MIEGHLFKKNCWTSVRTRVLWPLNLSYCHCPLPSSIRALKTSSFAATRGDRLDFELLKNSHLQISVTIWPDSQLPGKAMFTVIIWPDSEIALPEKPYSESICWKQSMAIVQHHSSLRLPYQLGEIRACQKLKRKIYRMRCSPGALKSWDIFLGIKKAMHMCRAVCIPKNIWKDPSLPSLTDF